MKKRILALIVVVMAVMMPASLFGKALNKDVRAKGSAKVTVKSTTTYSGNSSGGRRSSSAMAGGGDFGLGIMTGTATGLNMKIWNSGGTAFDIGLGWDMRGEDEELYIHGDYLFHQFVNASGPGQFGFHYGPGFRFISSDRLGFRFPLGIDFIFPGNVVDIYAEIAPTLDLVPNTDFDPAVGVGFRYYF